MVEETVVKNERRVRKQDGLKEDRERFENREGKGGRGGGVEDILPED